MFYSSDEFNFCREVSVVGEFGCLRVEDVFYQSDELLRKIEVTQNSREIMMINSIEGLLLVKLKQERGMSSVLLQSVGCFEDV